MEMSSILTLLVCLPFSFHAMHDGRHCYAIDHLAVQYVSQCIVGYFECTLQSVTIRSYHPDSATTWRTHSAMSTEWFWTPAQVFLFSLLCIFHRYKAFSHSLFVDLLQATWQKHESPMRPLKPFSVQFQKKLWSDQTVTADIWIKAFKTRNTRLNQINQHEIHFRLLHIKQRRDIHVTYWKLLSWRRHIIDHQES